MILGIEAQLPTTVIIPQILLSKCNPTLKKPLELIRISFEAKF